MEAAVEVDVVVVGGGAAGLAGAVGLARARRSVLVVDAGAPRNAPATGVHGYLGREGTPPSELLADGRAEVAGYGGVVVDDEVTGVVQVDGGFVVERRHGPTTRARRLLVTTGLVDELPDVPGLAERWGHEVLHCPYCHGWEVRDQAVAVLATSALYGHQALLWRQWTADLTVVLHGAPPPEGELADQLDALGVRVVAGPVAEVELGGGVVSGLRLADGGSVPCRAVVVAPRFAARGQLLAQLGLPTVDVMMGDVAFGTRVEADAMGATAVPGVWVAGNVADPSANVAASAASGQRAAHLINVDLITEDAAAAVASRAG